MTLLDSNAAIDLQQPGSRWYEWSRVSVRAAIAVGGVSIDHIILAELLSAPDPDRTRAWLELWRFPIEPLTDAVAHRAATARRFHLSRGGRAGGMLADFLIGAHAVVLGVPLITRDRQRFASYFPELTLIAPDGDD